MPGFLQRFIITVLMMLSATSVNTGYCAALSLTDPEPTITTTPVSGSIITCIGSPSAKPAIQQFKFVPNNLTGPVIITASAGFEVSFYAAGSYSNTITTAIFVPGGSISTDGTVYVRAAATNTLGNISGTVSLTSDGAATQTLTVSGKVLDMPAIDQTPDQTYYSGQTAAAISFTGTAATYHWVSDNASITTTAQGDNRMPMFKAINVGNTPVVAHITVTPLNENGCPGLPATFTMTVKPYDPIIDQGSISLSTPVGKIEACDGSVAQYPNLEHFTISAKNMVSNVFIQGGVIVEYSTNPTSGFHESLTLTPVNGMILPTEVYMRSRISPAGESAGVVEVYYGTKVDQSIPLKCVIYATSKIDITNRGYIAGDTPSIDFGAGSASATWTNDNLAIGLAAGGTGSIHTFSATNPGTDPIVAHITINNPVDPPVCGTGLSSFTITVLPAGRVLGTVSVGTVFGKIRACNGSPSSSPNLQQFTVSGSNLTTNVVLTSSVNFEIAQSANGPYSNSITLMPVNGTVAQHIIYVRSAAAAPAGAITGDIKIVAESYNEQHLSVSGTISTPAVIDDVAERIFDSGVPNDGVAFSGTATGFTWTNDNPAIGLPKSGMGNIPPFTPTPTKIAMTANITVTPIDQDGCGGLPIHFAIEILAGWPRIVTNLQVVDGMKACQGYPSVSPDIGHFTVAAYNLEKDVLYLDTKNSSIEISKSPTDGWTNAITLDGLNGVIGNTDIYTRLSAVNPPTNNLSSGIHIYSPTTGRMPADYTLITQGTVYPSGAIPHVDDKTFIAGTTSSVDFGEKAIYITWTNDNPAIGLPESGTGSIPEFVALNPGITPIVAHIVATLGSPAACSPGSITFKITVPVSGPASISTSGIVSQLRTVYGTPSMPGIFTVSGENVRSAITITPPPAFEVSKDGITFSQNLTVGEPGTITPVTIYIRLAKTTPAGTYQGEVVVSGTGAENKYVSLDNNNTVDKAALTITANNQTKFTGAQNPKLTIIYNGLVNNETASVLTTQPTINTTAVLSSSPGDYSITVNGASAANYSITYINGILTVKPVPDGVIVSNAFSPNGDGINDTWVIKNIDGFPNSTVQVFSRYGTTVFYSVNYPVPWDGRFKGVDLPVGTYYYIIDLKNGSNPATGWLAIIR